MFMDKMLQVERAAAADSAQITRCSAKVVAGITFQPSAAASLALHQNQIRAAAATASPQQQPTHPFSGPAAHTTPPATI
jgi:hypothetical protein